MMMHNLGSYLPSDRQVALLEGQTLPEYSSGAVLFADISGFTAITELLAQQLGPQRGAEELTHQLNRVYGALITQAHRYDGSVISFSGDAITCWFADDNGCRALTCAIGMQSVMDQFTTITTPNGLVAALTLHVAVAVGPVRRFLVGNPQIQQFDVLAGGTIDLLNSAATCARRGEVVADATVIEQLGSQVVVSAFRVDEESGRSLALVAGLSAPAQPCAPPGLTGQTLRPEQIRPWLFPAVFLRLHNHPDEFLAELRPAAALFLSFNGIDYDNDPQAGQWLDRYICRIQQVLERFEGVLLQVTIGEKGSFLYAAFGTPVAHDDEPVRALAAAQALRQLDGLAPIGPVRIGLTWGQMYTGAYGSASRRTYGVLGDRTNLAARLMVLAEPNTINCDDEIYRRTRHLWEFEVLPSVRVKGKAGLVRVYRPTGRPTHQLGDAGLVHELPPLMGRSLERAQLAITLDQLQAGHSPILLIEGEAGIGKSRLVAELRRLMQERGLTGLLGYGQSIDQRTPYQAWSSIFSTFFELDHVSDLAKRRECVRQLLHELAPEHMPRLPLLNDLLGLALPDTSLTAALDPALRQESLAGLLIDLLHAWARERPLVVVLEDAHWLDSLSWNLALRLGRVMPEYGVPILLVVVHRPTDGAAQAATLRGLASSTTLQLGRLPPADIVAMATARLGLPANSLPDELAQLLTRRSGGNPFFAEEMLYALRDQGLLMVPGAGEEPAARCRLRHDIASAAQALPETLHGMILARIDRLGAQARLALKVAAVIGPSFGAAPLQHVLNQYTPAVAQTLAAQLAELCRQDLLTQETQEPEPAYVFRHGIVQEVAYQTLLFAQRRELHQLLIGWYEARGTPSDQTAHLPLLAYHARYAEDHLRERRYARLAGEQAAAQYANSEAAAYFSRALELTPPDALAEQYELLRGRMSAYDMEDLRPQQLGDLELLAQVALALGDHRRQAEVALWRSRYHQSLGDYQLATAAASQAVGWAHTASALDLEAAATREQGVLRLVLGDTDARQYLNRALALAQATGLTHVEGLTQESLGSLAWLQGDYAAARICYERALTTYRQLGDRRSESTALNNLGIVSHILRDYSGAYAYYNEALRIKRELTHRRGESRVLNSLGSLVDEQGAYEEARHYFEQSLQIYREVADRFGESEVRQYLGLLLHRQGDNQAALSHCQQSLVIAEEIGSRGQQARTLVPLGAVLAKLGRLDEATAAYRQALDLRLAMGQPDLATEPQAGLARIALQSGDLAGALALVEAILDQLAHGSLDNTDEPFLIYLTCYQVLWSIDDPRASRLLADAYYQLQERAAAIDDPLRRQTFLGQVVQRQLVLAFEQAALSI